MDVNAVSAPQVNVQAGAQTAAQETGAVSFDQVMAQMAGSGNTAAAGQQNTLSWRELEAAAQQATAATQSSTSQELLDQLLAALLESGETDEQDPYGLLNGGSTDISDLMAKFQKQLGEESGDASQNPQIMALLSQMFGAESVQYMAQAAGTSTEQTLFDLMASQSADGLTQMVEALPASALQALMTTPAQDSSQPAFTPMLQNAQMLAGMQATTDVAMDPALASVQVEPQAVMNQAQGVSEAAQQAVTAEAVAGASVLETAQSAQAENAQPVAGAVELPGPEMVVETTAATRQDTENTDDAADLLTANAEATLRAGNTQQTEETETDATFGEVVEAATQQPARTASTKPTLEELQQQVDAGVHFRNTSFAQQVQTGVAAQAAYTTASSQVEAQVMRAMQNGTDEFTMRLMPEGLGEITVKLAKQADGTLSLNIVTKGLHAQQILTEQIDSLKQTLNPMNVNVETVLTEHQQSLLAQQQDMGGNARRGWQGMRGAAYYRDEPLSDIGEEVQQVAASMTSSRVLDTYI